MKILVSGAHGFIGTHLVNRLKADGHTVVPLPRQPTLLMGSFDYFYHLSSYGNHYEQEDRMKTIEANYVNLFGWLEQVMSCNVKGFVNISTSSVSLDHQTIYSASKMAGEYLCKAYAQNFSVPILTIRPASVYGPGEAEHRFIPTIIRRLKEEKGITIDPYATHTWLYVEDFVDALVSLMKLDSSEWKGQTYSVGTGVATDNMTVASKIMSIAKKNEPMKVVEHMRSYDTKNWCVYSTLPISLEWEVKTSLTEGLRKTYESTP